MADTTVLGYNESQNVTIPPFGDATAFSLLVADAISTSVSLGSYTQADGTTIPGPTVVGEAVAVSVGGAVNVGTGFGALLYTNNVAPLTIQAAAGLDVLSGTGGITYYGAANTVESDGVASIYAGGGKNLVAFGAGAKYVVAFGDGSDTVYASGSGLIDLGGGTNLMTVGQGVNTVFASGTSDTIVAGSGSATIGSGGNKALIFTGTGNTFVAVGGTGSTVVAGAGAVTVFAGADSTTFLNNSGSPLFIAPGDASATVVGGTTAATVFGNAGSNITYFNAPNGAGALLIAGVGSEMLNAAGSNVANTMFAGSGRSTLLGGAGADLIVGSAGTGTLTGGAGADQFIFSQGAAGGSFLITDFVKGADSVILSHYGAAEVASAISGATVSGGATSVALSDGTRITFANVSAIDGSLFKVN